MRKRKLLLFLLLAFSLLLVLGACGGDKSEKSSSSNGNDTTADENKKETSDSSSADSDETFVLKYNTAYPPSPNDWDPKTKLTEEFAKLVEERSDGRIQIEIFYSNQLAGQVEALDALAKGTFDIQNSTGSVWGDKIPEVDLTALMYWNLGEEHTLHMLRETEIADLFEESLEEYGVSLLGYWMASSTGILSTKPVQEVEDFKGIVMNVTSSLATEFYQTLGMGTATVAFIEQYEALLRGTIDAIQFPFYALDDYKLAEVVDYMVVPATVFPAIGTVTISNKTLEKLPEDLQQILFDTAREMELAGVEGSKRLTEHAYNFAEENGVEIIRLSENVYNELLQLAKDTIWKAYAAKNDRTNRIIEIVEEETEKWIEANPDLYDEFLQTLGN